MAQRNLLPVDINRKFLPRIRSCIDALEITARDMQGPVLTRLAQVHRKQEKRIFASEGKEGARGPWPDLSRPYAAFKRRVRGSEHPILVFSGDMKERFILPSRSEYIERAVFEGRKGDKIERVKFQFGARSQIAVHHFLGSDTIQRSKPGRGKNKKKVKRTKPFRSVTFRTVLPKRDMVTKTGKQITELRNAFVAWYRNERVPQVVKVCASEMRKATI